MYDAANEGGPVHCPGGPFLERYSNSDGRMINGM